MSANLELELAMAKQKILELEQGINSVAAVNRQLISEIEELSGEEFDEYWENKNT